MRSESKCGPYNDFCRRLYPLDDGSDGTIPARTGPKPWAQRALLALAYGGEDWPEDSKILDEIDIFRELQKKAAKLRKARKETPSGRQDRLRNAIDELNNRVWEVYAEHDTWPLFVHRGLASGHVTRKFKVFFVFNSAVVREVLPYWKSAEGDRKNSAVRKKLHDAIQCHGRSPVEKQIAQMLVPLTNPIRTRTQNSGPCLPPHHVRRGDLLAEVLHQIGPPLGGLARIVGLCGLPGVGKSLLAEEIHGTVLEEHRFEDGVCRLRVGREQKDPMLLQNSVCQFLAAHFERFTEKSRGEEVLKRLSADREFLLILDDIWTAGPVKALNVLGPRCQILLTTRDKSLICAFGGKTEEVLPMDPSQALVLFARLRKLETERETELAQEIVRKCGYLPLSIALIAAMSSDESLDLETALELLKNADLRKISAYLEAHGCNYDHTNLYAAIQASEHVLRESDPDIADHLLRLAVLRDDTLIPPKALRRIWSTNDRISRFYAKRLWGKSLVEIDKNGWLSLHDSVLDYLRCQTGDALPALNRALISDYTQGGAVPYAKVKEDGYYHDNLVWHLAKGKLDDDLRLLLVDSSDWIETRTKQARDGRQALADYHLATQHFGQGCSPQQIASLIGITAAKRRIETKLHNISSSVLKALVALGRYDEALHYASLRPEGHARYSAIRTILSNIDSSFEDIPSLLNKLTSAARQIDDYPPTDRYRAIALGLAWVAVIARDLGVIDLAEVVFRESKEYASKADDRDDLDLVLNLHARYQIMTGHLTSAEECIRAPRFVRSPCLLLSMLGVAHHSRGDKPKAMALFHEAITEAREFYYPLTAIVPELSSIGETQLAQLLIEEESSWLRHIRTTNPLHQEERDLVKESNAESDPLIDEELPELREEETREEIERITRRYRDACVYLAWLGHWEEALDSDRWICGEIEDPSQEETIYEAAILSGKSKELVSVVRELPQKETRAILLAEIARHLAGKQRRHWLCPLHEGFHFLTRENLSFSGLPEESSSGCADAEMASVIRSEAESLIHQLVFDVKGDTTVRNSDDDLNAVVDYLVSCGLYSHAASFVERVRHTPDSLRAFRMADGLARTNDCPSAIRVARNYCNLGYFAALLANVAVNLHRRGRPEVRDALIASQNVSERIAENPDKIIALLSLSRAYAITNQDEASDHFKREAYRVANAEDSGYARDLYLLLNIRRHIQEGNLSAAHGLVSSMRCIPEQLRGMGEIVCACACFGREREAQNNVESLLQKVATYGIVDDTHDEAHWSAKVLCRVCICLARVGWTAMARDVAARCSPHVREKIEIHINVIGASMDELAKFIDEHLPSDFVRQVAFCQEVRSTLENTAAGLSLIVLQELLSVASWNCADLRAARVSLEDCRVKPHIERCEWADCLEAPVIFAIPQGTSLSKLVDLDLRRQPFEKVDIETTATGFGA